MSVEEILKEVCKKNEESAFPLSSRQVCNVLNRLLEYYLDGEILEIALEYSVKMRSEIVFSTSHIINNYKPVYNFYTNLDYPIRRVLGTMGVIEEMPSEPTYEDDIIKNIKENLSAIEVELKEHIKTNEKVKEIRLRRTYAE